MQRQKKIVSSNLFIVRLINQMNEEVHEIIIWATDFMLKASVGEKDILIIFLQQTSNKFSSSLKIFKFQMLL